MSFPLLALALASFGIGTTEFVIMGLLPELSQDLAVTVPQAGMLVSAYALGVAAGSPFVAIATARLPRKRALLGLMAVFTLGNLGCALAPDYGWLMAARVLTSLAHGAFFGIAAVVAAGLVPRAQRARAVALVFAGLTLANVLGVPFGTALGQAAGWRSTFWVVTGIGVLAAGAIAWALPAGLAGSKGGLSHEFGALRRWRVLLPMLISMLASVSLFSVFTYITPLLRQEAGLSPHAVTWTLLLFGVGLTIGNLVGGRLADWRLLPSLVVSTAALVLVLAAFSLTSRHATWAVATVLLWGGVAFALIAPLQLWVVDAAREAPNLASTLNQSAFNMGNSIGAWVGGVAVGTGVSYANLPWIGALFAALGLGLTLFAWRVRPAPVLHAETAGLPALGTRPG
ncbi:MAG: MFS transporter [Janthinobacterium lividum]